MPDHVHFFCAPDVNAKPLSMFISSWKEWTSKSLKSQLLVTSAIWQAEFLITCSGRLRATAKNAIMSGRIPYASDYLRIRTAGLGKGRSNNCISDPEQAGVTAPGYSKSEVVAAGHFTRMFFRRYVGTSRSCPSTIVGSLFSNRPRLIGSNCNTSCLAWTLSGRDSLATTGFFFGIIKRGCESGLSTDDGSIDTTVGAGAGGGGGTSAMGCSNGITSEIG